MVEPTRTTIQPRIPTKKSVVKMKRKAKIAVQDKNNNWKIDIGQ